MMKRFLPVIILLVSGFSAHLYAGPSSSHNFIEQSFDVLSYDVEMIIADPASKQVRGTSEIVILKDDTAIPKIFYFHAVGITPDSVHYNGSSADYTLSTDGEGAEVYQISVNSPGSVDTVTVFYSGIMTAEQPTGAWGGVHYDAGILYNLGVGMDNPEVSAGRYWFPCYDHPSDKALFRCSITVPDSLKAVSNGTLEKVLHADNRTDTYIWSTKHPAATYLLNFAVGRFVEIDKTEEGGVPIKIWCTEDYKEKCEFAFSTINEMLTAHEELFGSYPFEKIGYVITEKGSMEHQTLINIASSVIDRAFSDGKDWHPTIFHELTHQHFGNSVSPEDFRHVWLNEAFATYSEALWYRYHKGYEAGRNRLMADREAYIKTYSHIDKNAPLLFFDYSEVGNYPVTIYQKGAVVLDMLRHEVGDSLFADFLREYAREYAGRSISTEDFIGFFETFTGKNLEFFFDQWLLRSGYPTFDIERRTYKHPESGTEMVSELRIRQIPTDGGEAYKKVPLEIDAVTPENENKVFVLTLSSADTAINIEHLNLKKSRFIINSCKTVAPCVKINDITTVGVDFAESESFNIYPNPAEDRLYVEVSEKLIGGAVSIYSVGGRLVLENIGISPENSEIDISLLPPGTYLVKIKIAENAYTGKFVKK